MTPGAAPDWLLPLVEAVVGFTIGEALVLAWWWRRRGRPLGALPGWLAAGLALMLALHAALAGPAWGVAAWLAAAGLAQAWALRQTARHPAPEARRRP